MKKLLLLLFLLLILVTSLSATQILPYYNFDFDEYLLMYNQMIVNDVKMPNQKHYFVKSLYQALQFVNKDVTKEELKEVIKQNDAEKLKAFVQSNIDSNNKMEEQDIKDILFNPDNATMVFASPTLDSAMSFFGHSYLMFYNKEAPFISPCINFYAYYTQYKGLDLIIKGLTSKLESYFAIKPFYFHYMEYTATLDRSLVAYPLALDESEKAKLKEVVEQLAFNKYPNYNFVSYNCTHGIFGIFNEVCPNRKPFPLNRALSPETAIEEVRKRGLITDEGFTFSSFQDIAHKHNKKEFKDFYKTTQTLEFGYKAEKPFENFEIVKPSKVHITNKFSALRFDYQYPEHRMSFNFSPLFNDFGEHSYVEREILNLKILSLDVAFTPKAFEKASLQVFSFDSFLPFSFTKKRPSLSSYLNLGFMGKVFYADANLFAGLSFGNSNILWSIGIDNYVSSYQWNYTLSAVSFLFMHYKCISLRNTTSIVLFSTIYDYWKINNSLMLSYNALDDLRFDITYDYNNGHFVKAGVAWKFNIF